MHKVHCIKCRAEYEDKFPDDYYCPKCNEERLAIAREVDARIASRPRKHRQSDFQIAETLGKTITSATGGQATFVRASDLGIQM